jgi:hypothetical protein
MVATKVFNYEPFLCLTVTLLLPARPVLVAFCSRALTYSNNLTIFRNCRNLANCHPFKSTLLYQINLTRIYNPERAPCAQITLQVLRSFFFVCLLWALSCLPVRAHGTTRLPLEEFYEVWYLNVFRKSTEILQVLLKSDKNNGYFTWRPIYVYSSLNSS